MRPEQLQHNGGDGTRQIRIHVDAMLLPVKCSAITDYSCTDDRLFPARLHRASPRSISELRLKLGHRNTTQGSGNMSEAFSTLQLLAAMYPLPDELLFDSASQAALERGEDAAEVYSVVVRAPIDDSEEAARRIEMSVTIPVSGQTTISLRQPNFLTRASFEQLLADTPDPMESTTDYIMSVIEYIRNTAPVSEEGVISAILHTLQQADSSKALVTEDPEVMMAPTPVRDEGPLSRVWFWLPSLDSKDKTREIVTFTWEYGLTGFVLAGKPGLICVEGGGKDIDKYMSKVKSESWGDVPSFQKKVSTPHMRLRSLCLPSLGNRAPSESHHDEGVFRDEGHHQCYHALWAVLPSRRHGGG